MITNTGIKKLNICEKSQIGGYHLRLERYILMSHLHLCITYYGGLCLIFVSLLVTLLPI